MNNQRDELRGTLANTVCNALNYPERARPYLLGGDMGTVLDKAADAILAAGYSRPRTVSTVEELDALPHAAVILDALNYYREAAKVSDGNIWRAMGPATVRASREIALPASVLYEPEGK